MECYTDIVGGHLIARLSGQFIFTDHAKFKQVLTSVEDSKTSKVTIDFAGVEFIDSAGLGMLLLLRDTCEKQKKSLTLTHPKGQVKKVFNISKFEHLFTLEE
jgi:anti-anti-sigma factor